MKRIARIVAAAGLIAAAPAALAEVRVFVDLFPPVPVYVVEPQVRYYPVHPAPVYEQRYEPVYVQPRIYPWPHFRHESRWHEDRHFRADGHGGHHNKRKHHRGGHHDD